MEDSFKIYVDQLRDGHIEKIAETFSADFIGLHDADLAFEDPVHVEGEAYVAEDDFVMRLTIKTQALVPCVICNTLLRVPVVIQNAYFAIPRSDIKTGVYDFREALREQIVVDAPHLAECEGHCPRRKELAKYLKEGSEDETKDGEPGYHPFADFDFK